MNLEKKIICKKLKKWLGFVYVDIFQSGES